MARAGNVYLVCERVPDSNGATYLPVSGFTVKYEMIDWLKRSGRTEEGTALFRLRDGRGHKEDLSKDPIPMEWPE